MKPSYEELLEALKAITVAEWQLETREEYLVHGLGLDFEMSPLLRKTCETIADAVGLPHGEAYFGKHCLAWPRWMIAARDAAGKSP